MRRARIKAVATVPVRRKATQETTQNNSTAESNSQADAKEAEKPPEINVAEKSEIKVEKPAVEKSEIKVEEPVVEKSENNDETKVENTQKTVEVNGVEEAAIIPEKPPASPRKETENLNDKVPENTDKSEPKTGVQLPPKNEIPQKTPIVEGSPVKTIQSRSCFMRPTPRLDGGGRIRRNSIQGSGASASESEDDSRRSSSIGPSRVRNDSVCSMQSLKDTSTSNIAKLNLGQKRRIVVSESARKLAEARREFLLKHEKKSPDKSKLTMYDLIYYNPTTNPMKPKPVSRQNVRKESICSLPEKRKEEENVDEPAEILVPQVKVGPNGQLIIDEQSLVIDQYKAQDNIDRSDIIVDEDTNGNGFYKRRKKSKEWSKWETMKFYKALSTYGTDFLLMQSIFPKRTRQELKLKYKKEERLNHPLVEKALRYQEFDTEALEKDLANVEEIEKKETQRDKPKQDKEKAKTTGKKRRKRCQLVANAVTCENAEDQTAATNGNSSNEQSSDENARITITRKVRKRKHKAIQPSKRKKKIINNNSDSESEMYKAKRTRSGRAPRKTKKTGTAVKIFDEEKNKNEGDSPKDDIQNTNDAINKEIERYDSQFNANLCSATDLKNMEIIIPLNEDVNNIEENITEENEKESENESMQILENLSNQSSVTEENSMHTVENPSNQIHEIEDSVHIVENPDDQPCETKQDGLKMHSNGSLNPANDLTDDDIPNLANLKPGSLVVLKKDSADEPGKTTVQVYIVSNDFDSSKPNCKENLLPIELSPDMLETVTNCINDIEPDQILQET